MRTLLLTFLLILSVIAATNPSKIRAQQPRGKEVTKLREEFIKATIDYRASLKKLLESYRLNVQRAEQRLAQTRDLYAQKLVEERDVDASRRALAEANDKVRETEDRIAAADRQIADVLREASLKNDTSNRRSLNEVEKADEQVSETISRSEDHFRKGKMDLEDNKREQARDEFDKAVDTILESGLDIRASQRLQTYYLDLIERIYREEVPLGRSSSQTGSDLVRSNTVPQIGFREEKFEPSPLDELSKLVLTPDEQNASEADVRALERAKSCNPGIISGAQLRGFRLGMSASEVKARLPQVKLPAADASGYSEASVHFSKAAPRPSFLEGVLMMVFNFIDGRVSYVAVVYDNSIKWKSLDQFTHQVSDSLALPATWQPYSYAGVQQRMLECGKLRFVASMLRSGTMSAPALFLVDNAGIDKLIARRLAARERARKAEELKLQKKIQEEEERRKTFKP